MNDNNSMRKTIYKNEIRYIFEKYHIGEAEQGRIENSIFENPYQNSQQINLKKDINEIEGLLSILNGIINNKNLIGAISSIFIVQEDLELPIALKSLFLENKKVGVLVGAGVSKLINLPLWEELADSAIEYLYDKNRINYFECQKIKNEIIDPKQKLTIFHHLISKNSAESKDFYCDKLNNFDYTNGNPYENLTRFDWIKLTSNIDKEFYKALKNEYDRPPLVAEGASVGSVPKKRRTANIMDNNFNPQNVDYDTIYHIHGSLDKLDNTVLTTEDYLIAYYVEKSTLKSFLTEIFKTYTIIFIGYGLEEFPILEHILKGGNEHYALIGTYLNETNFLRFKQEYLKPLKIKSIPFFLDFNGYIRLNIILDSWLQQLRAERNATYYENVREIDEVN